MDIKSILFFTSFVCIVYFIVFYYFNKRFLTPLNLDPKNKKIVTRVIFLLIYYPILPFILLKFSGPLVEIISRSAFLVFAFVFIVFPFALFRDALVWIYTAGRRQGKKKGAPETPQAQNETQSETKDGVLSRKEFLVRSNYALLGTGALMMGYGSVETMGGATVFEHTLSLPHLPAEFEGFKIVQLSDIHVGPLIKRGDVERLAEQVNELKPDMIAITGDLVDGTVYNLRGDVEPLKDMVSTHGSYFVTGNHEYYSGANEWLRELERMGLHTLVNEMSLIESRGGKGGGLAIAGVPDIREGKRLADHGYEPEKAIEGAGESDIKILLAHQPLKIERSFEAGYDIQLSGHTHGGQFFPWTMAVKLMFPYVIDLHLHKERMWINVNRGTGFWGPPIRIGVPSEITLMRLRRGPYVGS